MPLRHTHVCVGGEAGESESHVHELCARARVWTMRSADADTPALIDVGTLLPPPRARRVQQQLLLGPFRYYHCARARTCVCACVCACASTCARVLIAAPRPLTDGVGGEADHGWGCGYRTCQCILSWLSADTPVPTVGALQATIIYVYIIYYIIYIL